MHIEINYEYNDTLYNVVGEAEWEESYDGHTAGDGWEVYATNVFYEDEEGNAVDVFYDIPSDVIMKMECELALEHERMLRDAEEMAIDEFYEGDY